MVSRVLGGLFRFLHKFVSFNNNNFFSFVLKVWENCTTICRKVPNIKDNIVAIEEDNWSTGRQKKL